MDNDNRYFDMDSIRPTPAPVPAEKASGKGRAFLVGMVVGGFVAFLTAVTIVWVSALVRVAGRVESAKEEVRQEVKKEPAILTKNSLVDQDFIDKVDNLEAIIDQYFYLHEVSDEDLENGMFKGMLDALDDVYSEYYTAEELEQIMSKTEGTYYGIGAYVSLDADIKMPKISGVIKNTPAEEADIRADDIIYQINGESTYGLSLTEAVALIKGEEGTKVMLTILREGEQIVVPVTRAKVETPTVEYEMKDNGVGYIQITEFDDVTTDQFAAALDSLRASGMKGLVLDLRANPGGNLDTVIDIAKMILPEGLIVYTEDKSGRRVEYKGDGKNRLELPMTVLVDGNSASAAEILAGAIQDYKIGTLVGTTTFGKGIVQSILPLRDGSAVKITVSSYYTPGGRNIHGTGIEPDIVCEFDGETYYATDGKEDNQLIKAIEVLEELIQKNK